MENKISVILPIKSGKSNLFDEYFAKCIQSVQNQNSYVEEVVIVHTDETLLTNFLDSFDFSGLSVNRVVWNEEPNFSNQVNKGVSEAKSNWVSLLEFDDEYSKIWFKNVDKYIKHYDNVDAFLPIVVDVDEKGVFAGFTNEATFAANFTTEIGILTNDVLQTYQNFQISGMVIKKDTFLNNGGFKSHFKLTFGYEFFLRMTNSSVNFMTIPKIGYKHMNMREGSIFWNYKNGNDRLSEDEVRFWIESAKKEYLFTADREIKYEPQEV
jgi:glycosyltransferase involved in cell wall biosynthesis